MNTAIRYIELLRLIPRYPQKKSLFDLRTALAELGFQVSDRTIQRDLKKLESIFGLICDDRSIPYGWSFAKDANYIDLSALDESEAMFLSLFKEQFDGIINLKELPRINNLFKRSEAIVKSKSLKKENWNKKIRFIDASHRYLPPAIDEELSAKIIKATLTNFQILGTYKSRESKKSSQHIYNPLGIVSHGAVKRLICTRNKEELIRQLPIHRFSAVEILSSKAFVTQGFDLDDYIASGFLEYIHKKSINLVAEFHPKAGYHLFETPFTKNQRATFDSNKNKIILKAEVPDTEVLRRWILSFGSQINIRSPKYLRNIVANEHQEALK